MTILTRNKDSFVESLQPAKPSLFSSQSGVNGPSIPDTSLKLQQVIDYTLHFIMFTNIQPITLPVKQLNFNCYELNTQNGKRFDNRSITA